MTDLDNLVRSDTSVIFSGVGAIAAHYKGFSLSVGTVPYAGIYPVIDLTHIVPNGGPPTASTSTTRVSISSASNAREVRLAYGLGFLGNTVLGRGRGRLVSRAPISRAAASSTAQDKDLADLVNEAFDQNALSSTEFAFDLGAEVNLGIFRFGVVGTSLNEPDFDVAAVTGAPATVPLPRQIRGRSRRHSAALPDARRRRRLPEERHAGSGDPEPAALARRRVSHPALRLPGRRLS